ncbi:hypothetical protein GQX73_g1574 [Xylaria multiplex]|uniref:Protein SQS1 n=1 Tax=Xylaria multiplex TaxID=323545 RepID=A0A7C8MZF4_9PEZI|nr:hypothetical protein GQX73_g1574 [Xylaria multiplex]
MAKKKNNAKLKTRPKAKGAPPQHTRPKFGPVGGRDNLPFPHSHGYTLAEEARNTASNRRGFRGRDARLRYQPVTFLSAGFMDPLKDFEIPNQIPSSMQPKAAVPSPDANDESEPRPQSPSINHKTQDPDEESDASSDSSEEVILFKGRNAPREQQKSAAQKLPDDRDERGSTTVSREVNLELRFVRKTTDVVSSGPASQVEEPDFISLNTNPGKRPSSRKRYPNTNSDDDDDDAAIIADYIANMQSNFGEDEDDEEDIGHPGLGSQSFSILRDLGGDLDGTDSDAIPSQPSSGDESGDELDDDEGEDDAYEGEQCHLGSEDERLARLIAKQEELGLGGDDMLLLDGADPDDGWIAATSMPRRKKKSASKKSRMFQGGSQFPSATKMAEAFDELDLMDTQRSRLQRSKKGPISFGLSDSDLEEALNVAIKKDRLKKADKKKAREELRSQGLLGKNVNPHDLRIKYRGGMSLDDLADEVEAFMLSTREQLILPPFDKGARKIVHTIANTFNVKSKSAGTGTGRYPVLYRSKATLPYDQTLFEQAFSRVRRTWFPRVDVDEKVVQETRVLKRAEARTGKSRTGKSSIVLREGDIVGQHASEIGVENKGRAMLEKMGWTKGMSLGTVETKGITVPLTHVIKKTKAGLGDI